jgi:hypothetical protein
MERLLRLLDQVAMALMALGLIPFGVGLGFKAGPYIVIGLYIFGLALALLLIALFLRAIVWIRKNVRIE